jgi:hypothetical protein
MSGASETKKVHLMEMKDIDMGHFFIKFQDVDSQMDLEVNQRIEQQLLSELNISNPLG